MNTKFMNIALKLAAKGVGSVEPNPAVGCVIVKGGKIIGRGYHKKFGQPHAEINALADCRKKGNNPAGADMYVTLEPCCHFGKTPPCTKAVIESGVKKVFIAMTDPSCHCDGRGVEQLKAAGIDVTIGICEKEARLLNAPFIKYAQTGKPWVIAKWAQSIDGKLAFSDPAADGQWISNEQSRKDAHKLRCRVQAILVGIDTVIADDPLLTPRPSMSKKPIRIVLDSQLRIPTYCQLLKTAKKYPLLIFTDEGAVNADLKKANLITKVGAEIITVNLDENKRCDLAAVLDELTKRNIQQLLVEGGAKVIASFLQQGIVDELCVYIAPKILGSKGGVTISDSLSSLKNELSLTNIAITPFGEDVRIIALLKPLF
ncbi:MAG: bifunctional diaminohydroxyphosphoribosylaminopyrimidine deaminase/5-amino-6-(5-phosphoribosylamino)uracil reductase RibD [Phycisphaerae bacterium]|nr:bifunctional diaminohydroxyphosphoribosylaminopyrimidine deaminase/5-amino-6-(5-phosphoribosylamino)uracil reductase RibD [Phycisphaerae bacterium]